MSSLLDFITMESLSVAGASLLTLGFLFRNSGGTSVVADVGSTPPTGPSLAAGASGAAEISPGSTGGVNTAGAAMPPPVVNPPPVPANGVPAAGQNGVAAVVGGAGAVVPVVAGPPLVPLLPPVVTYLMAIQFVNNYFGNDLPFAFVDFMTHGIVGLRSRIIGPKDFDGPFGSRYGWILTSHSLMARLRDQAVRHGNRVMGLSGFDRVNESAFARGRMFDKIFQVIGQGNLRFIPHVVRMVTGRWAGFVVRMYLVSRRTNGVSYPVFEFHDAFQNITIRSDVGWTLAYFLSVKANLARDGASPVQASYVACASVIQLVGVAYGQPGNADWGVHPEDFGFAVPASMPW